MRVTIPEHAFGRYLYRTDHRRVGGFDLTVLQSPDHFRRLCQALITQNRSSKARLDKMTVSYNDHHDSIEHSLSVEFDARAQLLQSKQQYSKILNIWEVQLHLYCVIYWFIFYKVRAMHQRR